jgi:hypothetical protein
LFPTNRPTTSKPTRKSAVAKAKKQPVAGGAKATKQPATVAKATKLPADDGAANNNNNIEEV